MTKLQKQSFNKLSITILCVRLEQLKNFNIFVEHSRKVTSLEIIIIFKIDSESSVATQEG